MPSFPTIGDGQAGRIGAGVVGRRQAEATLAVAEIDAHAIGREHGQVGNAVAVEVGDANDLGGLAVGNEYGVGEAAAPQAVENVERCEPGLIVTRSVGPPGVSGPAATPAVASRLMSDGASCPATDHLGGLDPGAIKCGGAEGPAAPWFAGSPHLTGQSGS